jgi:hypothetical protein
VKKRKRLLGSEAIIDVKVFNIVDLAGDGSLIKEHVSKEEMCKTLNIYSFKRNLKKMSRVLAQKILTLFFKKLVDHILNGDRVLLPHGRSMYIGVMPKRKQGTYNRRHLNLHTGGKIYGVKLVGVKPHNYHFKLNPARRIELMKRIQEGQEYYE